MKNKKILWIICAVPILFSLIYGGGYIAQFIRNYQVWSSAGGTPGKTAGPSMPTFAIIDCLKAAFSMPYGIMGIGIIVIALGLLIFMIMRMGIGDAGELDKERNFVYSNKGTYGTAGYMDKKEIKDVLDLTGDIKHHSGTVLGLYDGKYVCVPKESRLNKNIAVYGASGSMKTRAFCVNRILQAVAGGESLIICDPKSELYEKTSEYFRIR